MNQVNLIGRITADLELKEASNGTKWTGFSLALNSKNSKGEDEVDFINIIAFNELAVNVVKHLGKGSRIGVTGRIKTSNYKHEKHDIVIYNTDIVASRIDFLDSKPEEKPKAKKTSDGMPF